MTNTYKSLRFTKSHEWVNTDTSPMAIGITDHAQHLLGDIVFIELPKLHTHVQAGQEIGVLESVKAAADYYAPVSGTITEINEAVVNQPELINQDPYKSGWICKITPDDTSSTESLLSEESYQHHIAE